MSQANSSSSNASQPVASDKVQTAINVFTQCVEDESTRVGDSEKIYSTVKRLCTSALDKVAKRIKTQRCAEMFEPKPRQFADREVFNGELTLSTVNGHDDKVFKTAKVIMPHFDIPMLFPNAAAFNDQKTIWRLLRYKFNTNGFDPKDICKMRDATSLKLEYKGMNLHSVVRFAVSFRYTIELEKIDVYDDDMKHTVVSKMCLKDMDNLGVEVDVKQVNIVNDRGSEVLLADIERIEECLGHIKNIWGTWCETYNVFQYMPEDMHAKIREHICN